jgi:hypothetical protein
MEAKKNAYRMLKGKPKGKRLLGKTRCRRVDNIEMDLSRTRLYELDRSGSG